MKTNLEIIITPHTATLEIQGEWVSDYAQSAYQLIKKFVISPTEIILDGNKLERLDTAGAWVIANALNNAPHSYTFENFKPEHQALMLEILNAKPAPVPDKPTLSLVEKLRDFYVHNVTAFIYRITDSLAFTGEFLIWLGKSLIKPSTLRIKAIVAQCERTGVKAAPLIAMISFLIAVVLAYQGSAQLSRFGAEIYTVDLVAISMLREMGVLLTAIMIAGRSGSAYAAELGVMKLNEEIDALKTIGMQPMEVLVLPRIIALIIMMPILTLLSDFCGLLGAGVLSVLRGTTSASLYIERLHDALNLTHFWIGMVKAPVFGLLVGCVGCYHGLQVSNSAESVGKETTACVVHAITLVMMADAIFSIIFTQLNL